VASFCVESRKLPFPARARIIFLSMDYDVAIIGGAFSGAATAVVLKRRWPNARVLIIEKTTEFDRKVGESTTEVSSCYMTRILGLTHHLGHHHLPKQGLRLWFSQHPEQSLDDCVELGARYGARLAGFQVDRATLDTHLLEEAVKAGCELMRPAKVTYHLMGYGWWCWIIPLRGGDVSAGIVYDSRIFDLPAGATLAQRLHNHLVSHPVGRAIFGEAQAIEGDVHAFSALPYWSEKVCGDGWAAVGDATSFIDPLYSPGLDFCSFTSYFVADLLGRSLAGENFISGVWSPSPKIAPPLGVSVKRIPAGASSTMASFPIFVCANKLPKACDGGGARNGKISRCHRAGLAPRLQLALSSRASSRDPVEYSLELTPRIPRLRSE